MLEFARVLWHNVCLDILPTGLVLNMAIPTSDVQLLHARHTHVACQFKSLTNSNWEQAAQARSVAAKQVNGLTGSLEQVQN